jgi:hypothetical protein
MHIQIKLYLIYVRVRFLRRSEGPGQVFLLTLQFLMQRLQATPEDEWEDFFLAYDNMCNLDRLRAARKPLPLPQPYDNIWLKINKVFDRLSYEEPQTTRMQYSSDLLEEKIPV